MWTLSIDWLIKQEMWKILTVSLCQRWHCQPKAYNPNISKEAYLITHIWSSPTSGCHFCKINDPNKKSIISISGKYLLNLYNFWYPFPSSVFPSSRNVSQPIPPAEGSSLLSCEGTPSDSYLQQLLTYADSVSNWISAEIVICDSIKVRGDITDERNRVSCEERQQLLSQHSFDFSSDTGSCVSHRLSPHMCSLLPL